MRFHTSLLIFLLAHLSGYGATIQVPQDYPTIQDAIDNASSGDTILVRPDTYLENIHFLGKAITLRSDKDGDPSTHDIAPDTTIIDGNQSILGSAVTFSGGEGRDTVLEGFKITNADSDDSGVFCSYSSPTIINNLIICNYGGGINCEYANPLIMYNEITGNEGVHRGHYIGPGGGIKCDNASPEIISNLITGNCSYTDGGGILCYDHSDPEITNNVISGNGGDAWGGGIYCSTHCSPMITNNTITRNSGGGIYCDYNSDPQVSNTIIWNNNYYWNFYEISLEGDCTMTISHSDLEGGQAMVYVGYGSSLTWGTGMLDDDPRFLPLQSGNWTADAVHDPFSCHITFTNANASWEPDALAGLLIAPDVYEFREYVILQNTATTITVQVDWYTQEWGVWVYSGTEYSIYDPHLSAESPCVDTGDSTIPTLPPQDYEEDARNVDGNGDGVEKVDMGADEFLTLKALAGTVSAGAGGNVPFLLTAGTANAYRTYLLLGGLSGTEPGIPLPGGMVTLPLNWDLFTGIVFTLANTSTFQNFLGTFDDQGEAMAEMVIPPYPPIAGLIMNFAYGVDKPWDFVSNPVTVEILP